MMKYLKVLNVVLILIFGALSVSAQTTHRYQKMPIRLSLWGAAMFDYDHEEPDPRAYAYTIPQGYYRPGEKAWGVRGKVRLNTIYLCKRIDKSSNDAVRQTVKGLAVWYFLINYF